VCLTRENFVAYIYGSSLDVEHLTLLMQRTRCMYGVHLDMNPGHTGMEFYRAAPERELPALGRALDTQWEASGAVSDMPGWRFLGRRMIRGMGLMNFPRYIQRGSRDFFYLTLRHVLPGDPLPPLVEPAEAGEGQWTVAGLPQHGFPYAVAKSWLRTNAEDLRLRANVLRFDPLMVRASDAAVHERTVVAFARRGEARDAVLGVWHDGQRFVIGRQPPTAGAVRLGAGYEPGDPAARTARGAFGVDSLGRLLYVELGPAERTGNTGRALEQLLARAGCTSVTLLPEPPGVALGGDRDVEGRAVRDPPGAARLLRAEGPGARRLFPETPVVPLKVWFPLQAKRVRYFPAPKPEPEGEPAASEPLPTALGTSVP
jgi:hypothetical protein